MNFQCKICDQRFIDENRLKLHLVIHSQQTLQEMWRNDEHEDQLDHVVNETKDSVSNQSVNNFEGQNNGISDHQTQIQLTQSAELRQQCRICLCDMISDIAAIPCCDHQFHSQCIESWSNITNKCPFCKLRFQSITTLDTGNVLKVENREQKVVREDLIQDAMEQNAYWDNEACRYCHSVDPQYDDLALICDGCHGVYHTFCIGLETVPAGDLWFCPDCSHLGESGDIDTAGDVENETSVNNVTLESEMSSELDVINQIENSDSEYDPEEDRRIRRSRGQYRRARSRRSKRSRSQMNCATSNGSRTRKRRRLTSN